MSLDYGKSEHSHIESYDLSLKKTTTKPHDAIESEFKF